MKTLFFCLILSLTGPYLRAQEISARVLEVYADKAQQMATQNPDWLKSLNDFVDNRVKFKTIPRDAVNDKYIKLSTVALINKYNPGLQRDAVVDPATFNPLKYDFVFSAKTPVVYRVDNTDDVIVIEPQSFNK